jgi:putative ABC transport system permease protein
MAVRFGAHYALIMMDFRHALRLLRKSPLFTMTVVLVIAAGIGATTAIFSVVNAVLLRPLPFADPGRLMQVSEKNDALHQPTFGVSALNYLSWKERSRSFTQLGAIQFGTFTLSGRGDPENYTGNAITASLMPLLGLQPIAGRVFSTDDERVGAAPVALIGESLWRRRFGADLSVVGQAVTLNGVSYTLVGIAPRALTILTNGDVWVPLVIDPPKEIRLNHVLFVAGRLSPGVTVAAAQAEMDAIARRMEQDYPEIHGWGVHIVTFTDTFVSAELRRALLVLLGAVVFVLLIVSANVANLLLARAFDRQKEMAVRAALGAGRARLLRQLLVESIVMSGLGGLVGVVAATWAVDWLAAALPPNVLPVADVGVDRMVLAFACGVTVLTGIVFGLAPAWHAARTDVNAALKDAGRSSTGARPVVRRGLAAIELALATVLLIGAALLGRSLIALQRVPVGFNPDGVITMQISLPPTRYPNAQRIAFLHDLDVAINALPGVTHAALTSGMPFGAGNYTRSPFIPIGSRVLEPGAGVPVDWRTVSPGYFATMGIPVLRGRVFSDDDTGNAPDVMIVSRATARMMWGDDDAVGRIVRRSADKKEFTVVGVVGDVRSATLNSEAPTLYYSNGVRTWPLMDIVIRTSTDTASTVSAVREIVRRKDVDLPLANVRPMTEWISNSAAQPRLNAALLALFAGVALLVAAVGTYGVLAYSVAQRTKELGLRMALGADRASVLGLVVREGMTTGAAGISAGVVVAGLLGRALAALVFGVSVWDASTYLSVSALLLAVALVSCVLPALRASRVDPMTALRLE